MRDGCPHVTVHDGKPVWSRRTEELEQAGAFVTAGMALKGGMRLGRRNAVVVAARRRNPSFEAAQAALGARSYAQRMIGSGPRHRERDERRREASSERLPAEGGV
jgi:hypothetical protein